MRYSCRQGNAKEVDRMFLYNVIVFMQLFTGPQLTDKVRLFKLAMEDPTGTVCFYHVSSSEHNMSNRHFYKIWLNDYKEMISTLYS